VLDIQVKARRINLLLFVSAKQEQALAEILSLSTDYSCFLVAEEQVSLAHPHLYYDAAVFNCLLIQARQFRHSSVIVT